MMFQAEFQVVALTPKSFGSSRLTENPFFIRILLKSCLPKSIYVRFPSYNIFTINIKDIKVTLER